MESEYQQIKFTDSDVVNKDDYIPAGESNYHNVRPFLLHDAGFVLAVVFADCLQDAIDIAVDAGKLDRFQIQEPKTENGQLIAPAPHDEFWDYVKEVMEDEQGWEINGKKYDWNESVSFLGNAGEPFDIESLGAVELPNPAFSFCALFNAPAPDSWEVIVGNVGSVYSGHDEAMARKKYNSYIESSKSGAGRAGGEDVTLMHNGDIREEYTGKINQDKDANRID